MRRGYGSIAGVPFPLQQTHIFLLFVFSLLGTVAIIERQKAVKLWSPQSKDLVQVRHFNPACTANTHSHTHFDGGTRKLIFNKTSGRVVCWILLQALAVLGEKEVL